MPEALLDEKPPLERPFSAPGVIRVDSMFGPLLAFENDLITDQIVAFGAHTRNELALLRSFITPGDVIYDIGAHIGTFALPLALTAGPLGLVVAVEADAQHFELLRRNLGRQGFEGKVTAIHAAVANELARYSPSRRQGNSGATYLVDDPQGEVTNVTRLDDLHARLEHHRRVAMIKIDVEGMELSVLKSGAKLIAGDHPLLYIEIAPALLSRHDATIADVDHFLKSHGYTNFFANAGERNSSNDSFRLKSLRHLSDGGDFFDLVAIHSEDSRLAPTLPLTAE